MALTVVVAYDISSDDRRARASAILAAWGERVQRSVFLCVLGDGDLAEVVGRLDATIDHGTDVVQFWRQCGTCFPDALALGRIQPLPDVRYWVL